MWRPSWQEYLEVLVQSRSHIHWLTETHLAWEEVCNLTLVIWCYCRCEFNLTKKEEDCHSEPGELKGGGGEHSVDQFGKEQRELILAEAQARPPQCTYCRYNVDHVFKTLKERETHEQVCPQRADYERKNAQTEEIYNRHKNYIEQIREKKR